MKVISHALVLTALISSAVLADDWPNNPNARASIRAPRTNTAQNFTPAPPSPLRPSAQGVRATGFDDDFDTGARIRQAQFTADDFTGGSTRRTAQQIPSNSAQRSQPSNNGLQLSFGDDEDFGADDNRYTSPPATDDDESSFASGNRRYVPPTDIGPSSSRPTATLTAPGSSLPARTPPPAAVPRYTPAVESRNVLDQTQHTTDDFPSTPRVGSTSSGYPGQRMTMPSAPTTTGRPDTTTPLQSTFPGQRSDNGIRQAQVDAQGTITDQRNVIAPPTGYPMSNPIESAANTAVSAVERGARGLSNTIRNGAEQISEEGRRRGNSYFLTLLALFASVGLNLYLGWIAWDTYNRYQDLVADMRYTGPRRSSGGESESTYGESSLAEPAAY